MHRFGRPTAAAAAAPPVVAPVSGTGGEDKTSSTKPEEASSADSDETQTGITEPSVGRPRCSRDLPFPPTSPTVLLTQRLMDPAPRILFDGHNTENDFTSVVKGGQETSHDGEGGQDGDAVTAGDDVKGGQSVNCSGPHVDTAGRAALQRLN
eukprot:GHVU01007858.1.p1 GENE.GHVU01007858.1~~GHVU01007858.1.p1  ORF type:complete len:152 (+),score=17.91 GHVU01007858.1:506-961(+)